MCLSVRIIKRKSRRAWQTTTHWCDATISSSASSSGRNYIIALVAVGLSPNTSMRFLCVLSRESRWAWRSRSCSPSVLRPRPSSSCCLHSLPSWPTIPTIQEKLQPCKAHVDAAAAVAAAEAKGLKAKLSSSSQRNCHFANQEFLVFETFSFLFELYTQWEKICPMKSRPLYTATISLSRSLSLSPPWIHNWVFLQT